MEHPGFGPRPEADEDSRYTNEAGKLYVGREFTPAQFAEWWKAQSYGSLPYNGVGVHHTAIPDRHTWIGLQHLHNTFSYYNTQLGWPRGKGPHLWLRSARAGKIAGPKVYVGTHPAHDGIGISYRNHRWLHIEFIDRFDYYGMDEQDHDLYQFVLKIVCGQRGIPLKHVNDAGRDGPSTPLGGYLFHRRARTDIKTCPGSKVLEAAFDREMREGGGGFADPKPDPKPNNPAPKPDPAPIVLYRVKVAEQQAGAFREKANAEGLVAKLKTLNVSASIDAEKR